MMRSAPLAPAFVALRPALAVAAICVLGACATIPDGSLRRQRPSIIFQNQTDDYVRVYLVQHTIYWLMGRVAPLATVRLQLPAAVSLTTQADLQLAVLPLASPRSARPLGPDGPEMIHSIPEPMGSLLTSNWRLSGRLLWSFPLPREPLPRPAPVVTERASAARKT